MFKLVKKEEIQDDINRLYIIREKLAPLKKEEEILSKRIKALMKQEKIDEKSSIDSKYIALTTDKKESIIDPQDLYMVIEDVLDFLKLVKVKITETKDFLPAKVYKSIVKFKKTKSLSIKKYEDVYPKE